MVKLDILSDPICPWCYIGKTNLFKALEDVSDHPFVLEWHPFQLNPDMPADGMDRRTYLERKFGGKEAAVKAYAPVVERAEAAGLTLNLDRIARTPNTLDAHRLIHWAGIEKQQTSMVDQLFNAYFVEGRDISDHEVLADLADVVGLDAAIVTRLLASDADVQDIRDRDAHSRKMGIDAVPTFIVANRHAVPGAQPVETWSQIIADIMAELEGAD
ncbi:Predicted dithiol-disulfide isomerase, DsbA family [Loktanella atrilutea]|uniref:Predicted dithiol-disulfide isomerase, DsbA family n=1 Tax=Loktanella atrilutea TaxID=366533 RepID=A0A1M4UCR2_LOKAT|nr:DsbA family oxidoreductase [Loktanella atrilutea]SHE54446.1 Predicted dithiol-disulfide isomerase, DsbA family [Loktanella atrilutea]